MGKQQPAHVAARPSVKLAKGEQLEKMRSKLSNAANTVRVAGPPAYRLPGASGAPFKRIYEGDALSWGPEAEEGVMEAIAAYEKAFHGGTLKLSRCIQRVAAAAATVPGRLEWLALSERARKDVKGTTLPPLIIDEVRTMTSRYYLRELWEEYGRLARILLAHAAEVKQVMGNEVVKSMRAVVIRMFERAAYEFRDLTRRDAGNARTMSAKATDLRYTTSYLRAIPDCHKCGMYECRRCGRSRQLRLIELYERWDEPVALVVKRVDARAAKERQRLLHAKKMEIAKAWYGKTW